MSFGRHQSFYLKKHWINKGIKALSMNNDSIFISKEGFKYLGIGKNMQQSLRYWLEATNIAKHNSINKNHSLTHFGELIKKYDSACSSPFSLTLVHYFLVNSRENNQPFSHTFNWFFLINADSYITKEKMKEMLKGYSPVTAENTINKDIDCLFQTYTNYEKKHPEDKNISLLADLYLLKKDKHIYYKTTLELNNETIPAVYYALYANRKEFSLTVENITKYIGSIFNFNRTQVIDVIEKLIEKNYPISLTRTNNLDTVIIRDVGLDNDVLAKLFFEVFDHEA